MSTATVTPIEENPDAVVLSKIRRYIKESPQNSRVIEFSPASAEQVLTEFNIGNRPKKPAKIAEYSGDMKAGQWVLTGDTIKFSDAGILRDGQNRLMAGVRSGVPFTTHVVFGIPDSAFDVMDRGRNRDPSDVLAIAGYTDTSTLAAAVRWAHLLKTGRVKQRDTFEPKEVLELLRTQYPDLHAFLTFGRKINDTPTGMAAAHIYTFSKVDPASAALFADAWASGTINGRFAPLGRMSGKIADIKKASSGRVNDVTRSALIVIAWNLFRTNRKGTAKNFDWTPKPENDFPDIV